MIENPPVNPITGAARTASAVQADIRLHHRDMRRNNAIPPVFLSDYVFFTVRGKGIKLGRVAGAPYGGALLEHHKFDVTEYEHTPQEGVVGFFGTFQPLRNPHYNPQVKGSLAYVRHRDVNRAEIVVFNVRMTGRVAAEDLRVTLDSLQGLARAVPDSHSLPKRLPKTHALQAQRCPASASQHPAPPPAVATAPSAATRRSPQELDAQGAAPAPAGGGAATSRTSQAKRSRQGSSQTHAFEAQAHRASGQPIADVGTQIEVYWETRPKGWFCGVVTENRLEKGAWVSNIKYDACENWDVHYVWHILDPFHEQHVQWRLKR